MCIDRLTLTRVTDPPGRNREPAVGAAGEGARGRRTADLPVPVRERLRANERLRAYGASEPAQASANLVTIAGVLTLRFVRSLCVTALVGWWARVCVLVHSWPTVKNT